MNGAEAEGPDLSAPLASLAWCWRIARGDGVVVGLTSHDRDLVRGGVPFRAAPGMKPSAIEAREALEGDTMEVAGAVTHDALAAADLDAGRWDGAAVTVALADWADADRTMLVVARGRLGATRRTGAAFTAELVPESAGAGATGAAPATSPTCRAMLGDRRCGVWLAPLRHRARVVAVDGARVTLDRQLPQGRLAWGRLRVTDGPATGLWATIAGDAHHAGADGVSRSVVTLAMPLAIAPATGTPVALVEGCDKSFATCAARFGNGANFRGEPHLPGNDMLTRYAGG